MDEILILAIIKNFLINVYILLVNFKIMNTKIKSKDIVKIISASILIAVIYIIMQKYFDNILMNIVMYFIQLIFLQALIKEKRELLFITNLISNAITYILLGLSIFIEAPIIMILEFDNKIINIIFVLIIEAIILFLLFRIKRFRNGFTFIQNSINYEYLNIIMVTISTVVILVYSLFGCYYNKMTRQLLMECFLILGLVMIVMLQKTLTLYYKQKLLSKTIEDYKSEIASKDEQIKKLSDEKFKISKLNHEFYNRQKALEKKVQDFVSNSNTETSSELSIMESISNLSKGYSGELEKIKSLDKLPTTEIEEIDDMFKYMQSECKNNNIDFKLHVNGNIYHMVNKIIDKDKLVTLIGDHLRDAIIAVNSSTNTFRSIIATIGLHDKYYEFCVHDTGIEFEIDTLLKLGLEPATTHKDTGGTGIGFITTFETLKETKGSLIIEEKHKMCSNDYTKTLIFRFDGKNEYKIYSYRADEIKKQCKDKRVIVKKLEYK